MPKGKFTTERKKKESDLLDETNVEATICGAIDSYHKKNMLVDAMFWSEAIRILSTKYGFLDQMKKASEGIK